MSHQRTTTVASSLEGQLSSSEITDHVSPPAEQRPGESATLISQPSITSSELPNTQEQNDDRNNEMHNTQINGPSSYDADDEHMSQSLGSQSASFTAEDVDQNIQEHIDNGADIPPPTEEALRSQAIAWMESVYQDAPNGTVITPPDWYAPSHVDPPRPRVWIKDFFTGRVRPRRLVNDRLANMSLAERERWANQQRRMRGEAAE